MSQNYFFAIVPRYLKPQHSFAKTIKPDTKYRIVLYKGIQKCDEMKQPIKSKLVGGKIDLQSPQLFFNVQFYSPLKNIQFTLKLYEEKPNEQQTQIASFAILSGDYIKSYKNNQGTFYSIDGKFKDDLGVGFDLVVEKSKFSLTDAMNKVSSQSQRATKQVFQESRPKSSKSKQLVRQGDGFLSPRKRLKRKSGHKGKLRSRNNSIQNGEVSSQGSVASSRRRWRKSPPSKQGQHFMHSPKKASPPKVSEAQKGKSIPKSQASSKSVQKKIELKPQVNQKSYNYKPAGNLKFQNTKEIFDIKVERNVKSPPVSPKQNIAEKPSVARSNIASPTVKSTGQSAGLQSPPPYQSAARQATSPTNTYQPLAPTKPSQSTIPQQSTSPKNAGIQPAQVKRESPLRQPIVSPRSSKNTFIDMEVKHTTQMFDIVQKRTYPSLTQQSSDEYQYQPLKNSRTATSPKAENLQTEKTGRKAPSPQKVEENTRPLQKSFSRSQLKKVEQSKVNLKKTDSIEIQNPLVDSKAGNSRSRLQASDKKTGIQQSNVSIKMQGSIHSPELKLISHDDKSQKTEKSIQVKQKAVKKEKGTVHESGTLRGSLRLKEVEGQKKNDEETKAAQKAATERKHQILYAIFLVVSSFLIYLAMTPTIRV